MKGEHRSHKEVGHWPYLAIVAIVAVVGVVLMVLNVDSPSQSEIEFEDVVEITDESGNLVGNAGYYSSVRSSGGTVDIAAKKVCYRNGNNCKYCNAGGTWTLECGTAARMR